MHIAVTGSRGLIGSALVPHLTDAGHRVTRLVRETGTPGTIAWDTARGVEDLAQLEGVDAVVHLAGESLAGGRWTAERKAEIRRSRVEGTERLCESLAMVPRPPRVVVSASAIGFYGDRGGDILSESSGPGDDFLARLCREWEQATAIASQVGIRVVHLRFGVVLSRAGGALRKMLLPFKLGMGGRLGPGTQFWSWIALDDALGVTHHALVTEDLQGPVNAVAPAPVTNAEFTHILARVLRRPALVPMPAFMARLVFGEVADALLLASQRVAPTRLNASGYRFRHPDLEEAIRSLLGVERRAQVAPARTGSRVWR